MPTRTFLRNSELSAAQGLNSCGRPALCTLAAPMNRSPSRRVQTMPSRSFGAKFGILFTSLLTLAACAQAQGNDKPATKASQTAATVTDPPVAPLTADERK